MLDIKFIRENADLVKRAAKGKRVDVDIDKLLTLDERRREHLHKLEMLKARHNQESKGRKGKPAREEIEEMRKRAAEIKVAAQAQDALQEEHDRVLWTVPNIVHKDTPEGENEAGNKVARKFGAPAKLSFKPKEHWELGPALGILDFEKAAQVSGSRFVYVKGKAALLQFAIINFVLDTLTKEKTLSKIAKAAKLKVNTKAFIPVIPPVMMRPDVLRKMARLEPREERYHIPSDDLYLVGSAEHTLGPLHMDETLNEEDLPLRYVGYSTCFRREAGTYGKDTKGIMRVHQFDKVEMESFTTPEQGIAEQDFLIAIQEYFMRQLELPYQVMQKCIGDMGAPDFREFDIECWLPGQNKYRETHTADYMTDYQARRLNIKYRRSDKSLALTGTTKLSFGQSNFVHTNDATALAISRTLVAILENYQQKDGSVRIPRVLQKLCGFKTIP